jgi:hypothetical protein
MLSAEDDEAKRKFIAKGTPQRTQKGTQTAWKTFLRWANAKNLNCQWMEIAPRDFAVHLETFIMEVKKEDGSEYKNNSIKVIISGIFRWRRENTTFTNDDFTSQEYVRATKILKSRNRQGLSKGLGKVKHAPLVSEAAIVRMLKHELCSPSNPAGLLNRVIVLISRQAMGRANDLSTVLREDVQKSVDGKGNTYFQIILRETKTRKGDDAGQTLTIRPQLGVQKYCPVYWLSFYLARIPQGDDVPARLLLRPLTRTVPNWNNESIWYSKQVIGEHKLREIYNNLGAIVEIDGLTGHSFRRSGVQALQEAGVPEQIIAKKVGHSDIKHLGPYCEVSERLDTECQEQLHVNSQPSPQQPTTEKEESRRFCGTTTAEKRCPPSVIVNEGNVSSTGQQSIDVGLGGCQIIFNNCTIQNVHFYK